MTAMQKLADDLGIAQTPEFGRICDIADSKATSVAAGFAGYVVPDDVRQELYAYAIDQERRFAKWLADNEPHRVALAMSGAARLYCHAEKARALGYEPSDVYFYSPSMLVKLIPAACDDGWDGLTGLPEDSGDAPAGKTPAHEGNNLLAAVIDVRRALPEGALPTDYDIETDEGARRLDELCDALGGDRPEAPGYRRGRREVISNARAQSLTTRGWTG